MKHSLMLLACSALLFASCGKSHVAVPLSAWEHYHDPYFTCSFTYPQGWQIVTEPGKVMMYSHQEGQQKFFDPTFKGEGGSQLIVSYERAVVLSLDAAVDSLKEDLTSSGFTITSAEPKTIEGTPATEVVYTGRFDERTRLTAARVLALKDSILYSITLAGFNDYFDASHVVLDSVLAAFVLPKPKIAKKPADESLPSAEFTQFSNNILQISYPSNFETNFPQPKGEVKFSLELEGYRRDCAVRIDQMPAKGLSVDKVFEQNEKKFKKTHKGEATVDGVKALYLDYAPASNVESRVYFLVKNGSVYRIIFNYYRPMKKEFLPAFEKTVASLRIK